MIRFALLYLLLTPLFALGQDAKPLVIGEQRTIHSATLGEQRTLNIYLPDSYNTSDTGKYPVIYLLDGGMDEDFLQVTGIVQFDAMPWIARIPESIVVGVTNTDRKRDMTFPTSVKEDKEKYPTTGGSAKFISFIEQDLEPYVQEHFRTEKGRTIIGQSLGGLLATEILLTKPYLFDKYIIISPSLWWDNGSLLKKAIAPINNATSVYIGVGKEGLAPTAEPHVMEVDANLFAEKLDNLKNPLLHVYLDYLPDENHATIGHQAVFNAFRKL